MKINEMNRVQSEEVKTNTFKSAWGKLVNKDSIQSLYQQALNHLDDDMGSRWPQYIEQFLRGKGATKSQIEEVIEIIKEKVSKYN
jgi:hypothetical protein